MRNLISALFLLAAPCSAQQLEKLSAGARADFDANLSFLRKDEPKKDHSLRFIGPGKIESPTSRRLVALIGDDQALAGGYEVGIPFEYWPKSPTLVAGITGFRRAVETSVPGGKDVDVFAGLLSAGVRQPLFRLESGDMALMPNVAFGWTPFTVSQTKEQRGSDSYAYPKSGWWLTPFSGFVSAGVDLEVSKNLAVGAEARRYAALVGNKAAMNVAGMVLTWYPTR